MYLFVYVQLYTINIHTYICIVYIFMFLCILYTNMCAYIYVYFHILCLYIHINIFTSLLLIDVDPALAAIDNQIQILQKRKATLIQILGKYYNIHIYILRHTVQHNIPPRPNDDDE